MNVTIGARIVKTGIAVALALYAARLAGLGSVTIAGVAAIFAIQPSVYRSWRHMLEQVQTNTIGALIALGVGLVMPVNEAVVGVTCIAVILVTLALRMESAVALTLVTTVVVLEAGGEWSYALERFSAILVGIAAAFAVNAVLLPPNHQKQFLNGYREALASLSLLLRTAAGGEMKEREAKELRGKLGEELQKLNERYGILEEDWRKWKKFRPQPGRALVVQKQMVRAMHAGHLALEALLAHYAPHRGNSGADRELSECLEELIRYHEYAVLKYEGKMKPGKRGRERVAARTDDLLRGAVQLAESSAGAGLPRVLAASAVYEYARQLRRLERLAGRIYRNSRMGNHK